ncbi:MAG: sulfite exporter TauE/SafE family protein [Cyanobium sp.]
MTNPQALGAVALTGLAAGFVNAVAGGGSLLSFPALIALGLNPLVANITNTVAMVPGYVGGAIGQRHQLRGQGRRLALLLPLAAAGGLAGGLLLLNSEARLFERLVPWLLLLGSLLVAVQEPLGAWLRRRRSGGSGLGLAAPAVTLAALYGGYFCAGLGVIVVAVLALTLEDSLNRLNGLKQLISLSTNLVAALLFVAAAPLAWGAAALMAVSALAGGVLGGRLASRIDPGRLRALVVLIGLIMAAVYFRR